MSLPIIRLRVVDANHATATNDPVTASCTLYTFLRSVPSHVECEMAMASFKRALQGTHGYTCASTNNARMLNLIQASIYDQLLRHPPKVIPVLARDALSWRSMLNRGRGTEAVNDTRLPSPPSTRLQNLTYMEGERGKTHTPLPNSLSSSYSTGEMKRGITITGSSSGNNNNNKSNGVKGEVENMKVVMETVSTDSMRFASPYGTFLPANLPGAPHSSQVSGVNNSCSGENSRDANESLTCSCTPVKSLPSVSVKEREILRGHQPHPLLLAMHERIRSALPAEEAVSDRQEREFATMMESRAAALRTKLSGALSMIPPQESEALEFVHQLEARVGVAEKLFEVQRHEEETIQISHCALKMEIVTMRTLLQNIVDAVTEAEDRHEREGPRAPYYAEECHVMAAIQQALDDLSAM